MRISARNQFLGKVIACRRGAVNDEIEIEISEGQTIVAIITHNSSEALKLSEGTSVFALIKASSIFLADDLKGVCFSARNQLSGKIETIQKGGVNSEVVLRLPTGKVLVAIVTNTSVEDMGLKPDMTIAALFKASSVLIGVKS